MSASTDLLAKLSAREREVLHLFLQDPSTKEIAHHLQLDTRTVSTHKMRLMRKLNLRNDVQLVLWAVDHGLLPERAA